MNTFKTTGTCSREIQFELQGDIIESVNFVGGCPGNLLGIAKLVEGMSATEAITRMEGIHCGDKTTSCPDQLAQALKQHLSTQG